MRTQPLTRLHRTQHGMAVLVMLLLLIMGGAAFLVSELNSVRSPIAADKRTADALAMAKQALIAYAVTDRGGNIRPGSLTVPDYNNNGTAQVPLDVNACQAAAVCLGRLPWRTLGLPDLRDSGGERLWYATSKNFRDVAGINSDTLGEFTVTGTLAANNVVAIIFAPGTSLGGQNRIVANQNVAAHYLEGENANGDAIFSAAIASGTFNDRIEIVTTDDIFRVVERRVAGEIGNLLRAYRVACGAYPNPALFSNPSTSTFANSSGILQGHLPFPAPAPPPPPDWGGGCGGLTPPSIPGWLIANQWRHVAYYAIASSTGTCIAGADCLTINNWPGISNNKQAIVIMSGRTLAAPHPNGALANYLEGENAAPVDRTFISNPISNSFNDQVYVVAP